MRPTTITALVVIIHNKVQLADILDERKDRKRGVMKQSISTSILRLSLLLVLTGFFLPVACDLNGFQVAQGILGHTQKAENARLLEPIEDTFGYVLFGVSVFAVLGLALTFLHSGSSGYYFGLFSLAASLVMLAVVALEFKFLRDTGISHVLIATFHIRVKLLSGGYLMAAGYFAGAMGFVLRTAKVIP